MRISSYYERLKNTRSETCNKIKNGNTFLNINFHLFKIINFNLLLMMYLAYLNFAFLIIVSEETYLTTIIRFPLILILVLIMFVISFGGFMWSQIVVGIYEPQWKSEDLNLGLISQIFISRYLSIALNGFDYLSQIDDWNNQRKLKRTIISNVEKAKDFLRTDFGLWFIPRGIRYDQNFVYSNKKSNKIVRRKMYGIIKQLDLICFKISTNKSNQIRPIIKGLEEIQKKLNNWDISDFEEGKPPEGILKDFFELIGWKQIITIVIISILSSILKIQLF